MEQPKFTRAELNEAFPVLFGGGKESQTKVPIGTKRHGGYLFAAITWSAVVVVYSLTPPPFMNDYPIPYRGTWLALASVVMIAWWGAYLSSARNVNISQTEHFERKYLHLVQNEKAYQLLIEAVQQRKKGILEGFGDKKTTEQYLRKLWVTAFEEAGLLVTEPILVKSEEKPIAERVREHLQLREQAQDELNSHLPEDSNELRQQN